MNQSSILIIDDDTQLTQVIKHLLFEINYTENQIHTTKDLYHPGELTDLSPQCIIANLEPMFANNDVTIHQIQEHFPFAPIIVLTERNNIDQANKTVEMGAADYLIKGEFNTEEFKKTLDLAILRTARENNYRLLFDDSPALMYIFDTVTFKFLAVNEAALIQYGYTRDEFLAMDATQLRPLEEVEAFKAANLNVPASYFDFGRWKHKRKDGSVFIVHIYAHTTSFEGNKAVSILAVDIDKKVKAEIALLEKNAEIEDIFESITDGFYAMNEKFEVTYINKEAEKILKCSRAEILGQELWEFFPGSKETEFYTQYQYALKEKVSVHFEEFYAPLGVWGSMHVYPTKEGLAVYLVDITAQKKIQEKILNADQNLRAIINNTCDMIWSIDKENNIITANDAFMDRMEKIIGRKITQFTKEDFGEGIYEGWKANVQRAFTGESFKTVWKEKIDEDEIVEEVSFNPILDKDKSVIGISCFSRDITDQHKYTEMIEKQNEQLKNISYVQSHEVRAPLSRILGLVALFDQHNTALLNAEIINKLTASAAELDEVVKKIMAHAR